MGNKGVKRTALYLVPVLAFVAVVALFAMGSCGSAPGGGGATGANAVSASANVSAATATAASKRADAHDGSSHESGGDSSSHGSNVASEASLQGSISSTSQSATNERALPVAQDVTLVVDEDPALYTYEDLVNDAAALQRKYPEWVTVGSLGTTVDGRDVIHLVIGNPEASNRVLVHGGIHAREYMTVKLVMKQASAFLSHAAANDVYGDVGYADLLQSNAIHVVPNVNPDGVAISQQGIGAIRDDSVRSTVLSIAAADGAEPSEAYFRNWKANANGVDLNRNFDALWDDFVGTGRPSSERYKGTAPGCEVESAALLNLTEKEGFSHTISYHEQGSLVYWFFGQTGPLYEKTQRFAEDIARQTGYQTYANYENLDPAGYKDWAIQSKGIPSLTIEIGLGEVPLPAEQFESVWLQNEHVWEAMLPQ